MLFRSEVRGKEASVLFQGMASGHSSLSTIHADSISSVIRRLETPPIELPPSLVNEIDAIAIMTHARIGNSEVRRLSEVVEVKSVSSDGTAESSTPLIWDPAKDKFYFKKEFIAFDKIEKRNGISKANLLRELETRTKILNELARRDITEVNEVQRILTSYMRNPTDVLNQLGLTNSIPKKNEAQ